MSRRMSCSMTIDSVKDRTKTVTRRHVDTWSSLRVGGRLTLIEKGMGLAKGERQVVLAEVEIVSVTVEPLSAIRYNIWDLAAEGFSGWLPSQFIEMWLRSHGYQSGDPDVRRIEWRYLS